MFKKKVEEENKLGKRLLKLTTNMLDINRLNTHLVGEENYEFYADTYERRNTKKFYIQTALGVRTITIVNSMSLNTNYGCETYDFTYSEPSEKHSNRNRTVFTFSLNCEGKVRVYHVPNRITPKGAVLAIKELEDILNSCYPVTSTAQYTENFKMLERMLGN